MAGKNAWKSVKLPSLKVICRKLTTTYLRNVAALNYRPFNCGGKGKFRAPPRANHDRNICKIPRLCVPLNLVVSTAILRKGIFFRVTVRYDLNVFLFLKPWCTLIKSWHFPPITKSVHFIHLSLLIIYKRKRLMAFLVNKNAATIYAGRVLSRVFKGSKLPPTKSSQLPPPPPPPKKRDCYHYSVLVTISEESSGRDEVSSLTVTFLKIVSQNVPSCILAHIHFKEFPGGHTPTPLRRSWPPPLGISPPNDKS